MILINLGVDFCLLTNKKTFKKTIKIIFMLKKHVKFSFITKHFYPLSFLEFLLGNSNEASVATKTAMISPEIVALLSFIGISVSLVSITGLYLYNGLLFFYPSVVSDLHAFLGFKTFETELREQICSLQHEVVNLLNQNSCLCKELVQQKIINVEVIQQVENKFLAISRLIELVKSQGLDQCLELSATLADLKLNLEALKASVGAASSPLPEPVDYVGHPDPSSHRFEFPDGFETDLVETINAPITVRPPVFEPVVGNPFNIPTFSDAVTTTAVKTVKGGFFSWPNPLDISQAIAPYVNPIADFASNPSLTMISYMTGYVQAYLPSTNSMVIGGILTVTGQTILSKGPAFFAEFLREKTVLEKVFGRLKW